MWKDVIELGNTSETIEKGEPVQSIVYREVFANRKSVRMNEFYQAANAGLKPELIFEMYSFEFKADEFVRYPTGSDGRFIQSFEAMTRVKLLNSHYLRM